MSRHDRPPFDAAALRNLAPEQRMRLVFDWWCDDDDRRALIDHFGGRALALCSRAHPQDDPAPPRNLPLPQGPVPVYVVSDPKDVAQALHDAEHFSNIPYAALGGAGFMLAMDPLPAAAASTGDAVPTDWHRLQRRVAEQALGGYASSGLAQAAALAVEQAALLSLQADAFDLAEFAEQAALRWFGLLFGYAGRDHAVLEAAARSGYRGLQYLIVGRHFCSEPQTLPAAEQALARLATRTDELMDAHARLQRSPRRAQPQQQRADATWPDGVQPWSELGLHGLGEPVLRRLPGLALQGTGPSLSGQDLCTLVGGLLVGTVGNVQAAVCGIVDALLRDAPSDAGLRQRAHALDEDQALDRLLALHPPVRFLPRRTRQKVRLQGRELPAGHDCILVLDAWTRRVARQTGDTGTHARAPACPFDPWGGVGASVAPHACVGQAVVRPLLRALLQAVLRLPGLADRLDAVDGQPLGPQRLWGFGVSAHPLQHDRVRRRVHRPLLVAMRVKQPVAEHARRLREVIRSGAPRIEAALRDSNMVHVAWFEFQDNDHILALRTVYDGEFDSYVQHFALTVGDLFDELFASLEGAPPLPVREHPWAFVEAIRRHDRSPAGGYFFSAHPQRLVHGHPGAAGRP